MRWALWLVLFVVPNLVGALEFDCRLTEHQELCQELLDSALSDDEKEYLISDLISDTKTAPSHDFVREHNLAIGMPEPPNDVEVHDSVYITGAWVTVLSVMPSVLEEDVLLISDHGEVLTAYGYDLNLDDNILNDDCDTQYSVLEHKGDLRVYRNDAYLGSERLLTFTTQEDSKFKAEYDITVRIAVDHYRWQDNSCQYAYSEDVTDRLTISDTLDTLYYATTSDVSFRVKDRYSETTLGEVVANNVTSLHLDFANASFDQFTYFYEIALTYEPYNMFTVKAIKNPYVRHTNLIYSGENPYEIRVNDPRICTLTSDTHFSKQEWSCNLDFSNTNVTLTTDKLLYTEGEPITLTVTPSDQPFIVTYADTNYSVQGNLEVDATYPYNKLTLTHDDRSYDTLIHVTEGDTLPLLLPLLLFGTANLAFSRYLTNYFSVGR